MKLNEFNEKDNSHQGWITRSLSKEFLERSKSTQMSHRRPCNMYREKVWVEKRRLLTEWFGRKLCPKSKTMKDCRKRLHEGKVFEEEFQ